MKYIEGLASEYWQRYGKEIWRKSFVFENRRSGRYFQRWLSRYAGCDILSPEVLTIGELMERLSDKVIVDELEQLWILWGVYKDVTGREDSFDDFVYWGEMLLSDFDELDRWLIDARMLYGDLSDMREIDIRFGELGEQARERLRSFMLGFAGEKMSEQREKFLWIWGKLSGVYEEYRRRLGAAGKCYKGMLEREVVEGEKWKDVEGSYVFVGLSNMSRTEERLVRGMVEIGKGEVYEEREMDMDSLRGKKMRLYRVSSDDVMCKVVGKILSEEKEDDMDWCDVGVLLPDESMLENVIDVLPESVGRVNITMGKSMRGGMLCSLVEHLSEMHVLREELEGGELRYDYRSLKAVLLHPLIVSSTDGAVRERILKTIDECNLLYVRAGMLIGDEMIEKLGERVSSEDLTSWLRTILEHLRGHDEVTDEEIYRLEIELEGLERLSKQAGIQMSVQSTWNVILERVRNIRMAYRCDDLDGLQVMGVLEGRLLGLRKIILTDFEDEELPGRRIKQSYIPYELRRVYGLPTTESGDRIFRNNFYGMLLESESVSLIQNMTVSDDRSGEVSRYRYELEQMYGVEIEVIDVESDGLSMSVESEEGLEIVKTDEVMRRVVDYVEGRGISASALNSYMEDPVTFYLQYVCGYKERRTVESGIAMNDFGTVCHEVLELLYKDRKRIDGAAIDDMQRVLRTTDIVERCYKEKILKGSEVELVGRDRLPLGVIRRYVERVLDYDRSCVDFEYVGSEYKVVITREVGVDEKTYKVKLQGIIDRLDRRGDVYRVIDYKTGKEEHVMPKEISGLYAEGSGRSQNHVRQTLFYCMLCKYGLGIERLEPHVYYLKNSVGKMDVEIVDKKSGLHGYEPMQAAYEEALDGVIREILNPLVPFRRR